MADSEDIALMAHLMRRAGFGCPRDELEALAARGYEEVVEDLVDPEARGIPGADLELLFRYYPNIENPEPPPQGRCNVIYQMINSPRQLEEKMVLFWHTVFATGNAKINSPPEMVRQINMFRRCGMGNYRDLLVELAKDPAMIYWLDNNYNHKDQPNENWGRELLELFSMGQGNYTEKDVFECSRAFTGWTIAHKIPGGGTGRKLWPFIYNEEDHDDSEKEFLGHRGRFNGEDIIEIVVRQPATSRFIARHLYNFFVADEVQVPAWLHSPPRDSVAMNIIGDAFINSGLDMKATLRVLFNSDFFKESMYKRIKSPAELVVGTLRVAGDFRFPRPGMQDMAEETGYMGQEVINPPSVEGWHFGAEWIDSGALVRRINFAADLFANPEMPGVQSIIQRIHALGDSTAAQMVDECLDLMGPVQVEEGTKEELVSLAERAGNVTWGSEDEAKVSSQRVADMLALIASSREFQFA